MILIRPYIGYGTARCVRLRGRVLQDEGLGPARDADSRWRNLVAFYRRMESDEVPGAKLRASLAGRSAQCLTNREGYFDVALDGLSLKSGWHTVHVELRRDPAASGEGRVLVPSLRARFGVISDIDDTVVHSGVQKKLRMVLALASSNARTRKPFPGVAAFYRALHAGHNPIFYVSKSPWNLYQPIVEFLAHQRLPAGPLALRDFGLRMDPSHKTRAIEEILRTYARLPFVLIGDSGEQDPEIYSDIVHRFPGRIRVVYIRSVDDRAISRIGKLSAQVARTGCQLVLAPDSAFAAAHAAGEGLIQPSALPAIRSDRRSDERSSPNPAASSGAL